MRLIRLSLLFMVICSFSSAIAQKGVASIQGSVLSAPKKVPLIDAVVILTSPDLNGSRISLTDSAGNYQINNLVAGTYTVAFEMEGFKTAAKSNIVLSEGGVLNIQIEMVRTGTREKGGNRKRIVYVSSKARDL